MNLLMLALIKKAVDEQNRGYRRSRKKGKEAPQKHSSYSSTTYTENEFLTLVIAEDPVLKAVFQAIEEEGKEIDKKDAEEIRKDIAVKLEEQANRVKKMRTTLTELEGLGVKLTDSYGMPSITVGKKVTECYERAYGEKGEYAKTTESFPVCFEGLNLQPEWFKEENRDINPFDREYKNKYETHHDIDEQIEALKKKVEKCERSLKFAVFGKYEKEDELRRAKDNLKYAEYKRENWVELKTKKETFDKLTPEQRVKLNEYFEILEEATTVSKEINVQSRDYDAIVGHYYSYSYYGDRKRNALDRNKWQRSIDSLIERGELSEELLDAVDTLIAEEDIGYEKYYEGLKDYGYGSHGLTEDCASLIRWYLDTRKEKIALKALHRREESFKRLEAEHKKLVEAAGLVDKAEELEGQDPSKKGDEINGE